MAYNPNTFEYVYGQDLLDTAHNYFPELLYDTNIFNNTIIRWIRYRISVLFPHQYTQKQNEYRIYQSHRRQTEFANWNSQQRNNLISVSTTATPAVAFVVPSRTTPASTQPPATVAPPPATTATNVNTHRVPVVERWSRTQHRTTPDTDQLITNLFSELGLLGEMPSARRGIVENTNTFTSALNLLNLATMIPATTTFQDVVVAASNAQIEAGSTIVNSNDVPNDTACAICQESTENMVWRQLHCNHYFHRECIDAWFQRNTHCPVCRADIREPEHTADTSDDAQE